jgi:hypothetical protein
MEMGHGRKTHTQMTQKGILKQLELGGLALGFLILGCISAANAQTTYINPNGFGGYTITQPGAMPYRPPTYMNPNGFGGYTITQPGSMPYQPRCI